VVTTAIRFASLLALVGAFFHGCAQVKETAERSVIRPVMWLRRSVTARGTWPARSATALATRCGQSARAPRPWPTGQKSRAAGAGKFRIL